MNKEVKVKWLAALRSGEYQQGFGRLKSTEGLCCLGVLCDVYSKEKGVSWQEYPGNSSIYFLKGSPSTQLPPKKVQDWAGINESPSVQVSAILGNAPASLWVLNDNRRLSFSQIADIIEEQL